MDEMGEETATVSQAVLRAFHKLSSEHFRVGEVLTRVRGGVLSHAQDSLLFSLLLPFSLSFQCPAKCA